MVKIDELKKIIAQKFGVEPSEITEESFIMEDLNLGELELIELLEVLEDKYELDEELIERQDEIDTVGDLQEILTDILE